MILSSVYTEGNLKEDGERVDCKKTWNVKDQEEASFCL